MTKRFMNTTAMAAVLVGLGLAEASATATMPELKITGDAKAVFATTDQTRDRKDDSKDVRSGQGNGHAMLFTGGIDFSAEGKLNETVDYSMVIGMTGDMNPGNVGSSASVRKSYIDLTSPWGSVLVGNNESPIDMLSAGAANVMGGEGGWNGTFGDVTTFSTGVCVGDSINADPGSATSLVYATPDEAMKGFKVIVGFTPNTTHTGFMSPTDNKNQNGNNNWRYMYGDAQVMDVQDRLGQNKSVKKNMFDMRYADPSNGAYDLNAVSGGFTYAFGDPSNVSFAFSASGVMGKSKYHGDSKAYNAYESPNSEIQETADDDAGQPVGTNVPQGSAVTSKLNDTKAYQLGANVGYKGFELGVTWTDNGKSRVAKRFTDKGLGTFDAGKIISVAAGYTWGDWKFSGGWSQGKRKFGNFGATVPAPYAAWAGKGKQETKSDTYSVAMDYHLTPGWKFSTEYTWATMKTCDVAKTIAASTYGTSSIADNKPKAFMVSTAINF